MSVLMVTGIEGARNCADQVSAQLGMRVDVASGRKDALAALRQHEFFAVVVDETLAESAIRLPPRRSATMPAWLFRCRSTLLSLERRG